MAVNLFQIQQLNSDLIRHVDEYLKTMEEDDDDEFAEQRNKYYVILYHGRPKGGCYSIGGESWYFDTLEEARRKFTSITKGYSKKELGFTGQSGEEYEWIDDDDKYAAVSEEEDAEPVNV